MKLEEAQEWIRKYQTVQLSGDLRRDLRNVGEAWLTMGCFANALEVYDLINEEVSVRSFVDAARATREHGDFENSLRYYQLALGKMERFKDAGFCGSKNLVGEIRTGLQHLGDRKLFAGKDHGGVNALLKYLPDFDSGELSFSGKDWEENQTENPFSMSEKVSKGEGDDLEMGVGAAKLRLAYEWGMIADVKKRLDPLYQLTADEKSGLAIYKNTSEWESRGEFLQWIKVLAVSNEGLELEILEPPEIGECSAPDRGVAKGGKITVARIDHGDGDPIWTIPIQDDGELIWYKHGLPLSLTADQDEAADAIGRYIEQATRIELSRQEKKTFGLMYSNTFQIVRLVPGNTLPLHRIFDAHCNHNPYALVLGTQNFISPESIGVREVVCSL